MFKAFRKSTTFISLSAITICFCKNCAHTCIKIAIWIDWTRSGIVAFVSNFSKRNAYRINAMTIKTILTCDTNISIKFYLIFFSMLRINASERRFLKKFVCFFRWYLICCILANLSLCTWPNIYNIWICFIDLSTNIFISIGCLLTALENRAL